MLKLFFHDPNGRDWSVSSYESVFDIRTAADLGGVARALSPLFPRAMFFLMREGVSPTWEDPANRDGGCVSFTVPVASAGDILAHTLATVFSGNYAVPLSDVCGVSVAPKRGYCVIRIWTRDHPMKQEADLAKGLYLPTSSRVHYKPHADSMGGKKIMSTIGRDTWALGGGGGGGHRRGPSGHGGGGGGGRKGRGGGSSRRH